MLNGCLLFSDVSGFTALSERLAVLGPKGAEHLTEVINRYFTEMIDILSRSNGTLLKFAGDATLVYFSGTGKWRTCPMGGARRAADDARHARVCQPAHSAGTCDHHHEDRAFGRLISRRQRRLGKADGICADRSHRFANASSRRLHQARRHRDKPTRRRPALFRL